jgi:hypothetical protein
LRIADFEDVAGLREGKSFGGQRFLQILGVEDAEAVLRYRRAQILHRGFGCFVCFDDVAHRVPGVCHDRDPFFLLFPQAKSQSPKMSGSLIA